MTLSAIKLDTHFLAGSTSATYWAANMVRNINIEYSDVCRLIWESDGTWNFDDSNNGTAPVAYRTVANASASYTVPTTAMRIEAIEIKDNTGTWQKLKPITLAELTVSPENYLTGGGIPTQYMLEGNEIRLFPPPGTGSVTMSSGMAVRLSREVTLFGVSATSTVPGFGPSVFHRLLSCAAALDFTQDENQRKYLQMMKSRLENGLIRFYSKRADELRASIQPSGRRRWQKYT